jgi:hypothetical protein
LFLTYSITIFLNAALLFLIEPMVAKMILPFLGGTPAVWNMSLFFFQALLLMGYLYAHLGNAWLGVKKLAVLHLVLVLFAVLFLPVMVPNQWFAVAPVHPARLVLSVLFAAVGFPFFILAAGSPLLQKWFASTAHPSAHDPYFLYAASNLGSMVGLILYPTLLEPHFSLFEQSRNWFYSYLVLIALTAACIFFLRRFFFLPAASQIGQNSLHQAPHNRPPAQECRSVTWPRRIRWVALSFVPSSLLLGVTTYVTTDLASAPLFWTIPLILYLLSFVLTFSRQPWLSHGFVVRRQSFLLVAAAITVFAQASNPVWILLPLHLLAFFVTALVCHGELARDRPAPSHLTEFYLWLSIGGVLGGFFNALLAPLIFRGVYEYPLAMIGAALLRPYLTDNQSAKRDRRLDLSLPAGLGLFVAAVIIGSQKSAVLSAEAAHLLIFGTSAVVCLSFACRPVRLGLGMGALMLASALYTGPYGDVLYSDRSFFGIYRAMLDKDGKHHLLLQGTTIHGTQRLDPNRRLEPSSYYYPTSPVGQVFSVASKAYQSGNIAVVGLGTGALSCKGTATQRFTFYEIDPLVERIVRNANLFSYLRDCPPQIRVILGDARLSLAQSPDHHYQLFVLDAFSSDVIPIHLLTREALQLYLSKLDEHGILLFHISNRYMELAPVLDRLASSLNLTALARRDMQVTAAEQADGKLPSEWVAMARHKEVLGEFLADPRWELLAGRSSADLWTDDYSNVLRVIRWQ